MSYSDQIRNKLAPHVAKIDALSVRERLLVLITSLALIAALWHTLLMQPLEQRAQFAERSRERNHPRVDGLGLV